MRVFGYDMFLVRSSYVGFYLFWLVRGDDGQSRRVAMGLLIAVEAGPVWLIRSVPGHSVADAGVVAVAWSAAVGAPFVRSMVLFGTIPVDACYW